VQTAFKFVNQKQPSKFTVKQTTALLFSGRLIKTSLCDMYYSKDPY